MNTNVDEFTVPEKILLAADHLDKQGQSPFSAEALTVASWQKFPKTFGLSGFADQHPDSNKILTSIMGEKGLVRRGWLAKTGPKLYTLTREGRQLVRRVTLDEESPPAGSQVRLSREQERFLRDRLDSSAVAKINEGHKSELTFADACRFWGSNENAKSDFLDERMEQVERLLAELERLLADNDAVLPGGTHVDDGTVRALSNIHRYMEDRFDRHLNLLRSRSGRR